VIALVVRGQCFAVIFFRLKDDAQLNNIRVNQQLVLVEAAEMSQPCALFIHGSSFCLHTLLIFHVLCPIYHFYVLGHADVYTSTSMFVFRSGVCIRVILHAYFMQVQMPHQSITKPSSPVQPGAFDRVMRKAEMNMNFLSVFPSLY
jgi:hypothetical protein